MSDVPKIVQLLRSDAIEKQIAAAIVLGELRAKGPGVVEGLGAVLASGVPLLQTHALEALARVGAKRALAQVFPLLESHDDGVRRAATKAIVSVGEEAVPQIQSRLATAGPDLRRGLDATLAELGGKDAFSTLVKGLSSSDPEAAKAAALAVRQQLKSADGNKRRSYLAEIERFLDGQKTPKRSSAGAPPGRNDGAIAAAVKILGYLEDEKTAPTLVAYAGDPDAAPAVRQEAIIALRFALGSGKPAASAVNALLRAAEAPDRTLAQTALHTLASLKVEADVVKKLEPLALHPDVERARFVLAWLGRLGGPDAARVLTKVLIATKDRRYTEEAARGLHGKDEAASALARALLDTEDADQAWILRNALHPLAPLTKKIPPAVRKQLVESALERVASGAPGWEALLDIARDADGPAVTDGLRAVAQKLRRASGKEERARSAFQLLCKSPLATDDDRYALAALELGRSSRDTRPASRAGDESLRLLSLLLRGGFDVGKAMKKDRAMDLEQLYYVGFHFTELDHPIGEELLEEVVRKGGRTKIGKMAKNKLALDG